MFTRPGIIWSPGSGFTKDWWPERFHRVSETRPPCGPWSWDPRGSDVAVALPWTHRLTSSQRVVEAKGTLNGTVTSQRWGNRWSCGWTFWEALCELAIDLLVRNWATLVGSSREVPWIFSDLQMNWIDEAFAKVPKILSTFTGVDHIASYSSNWIPVNCYVQNVRESPTSLGTPGLYSLFIRFSAPKSTAFPSDWFHRPKSGIWRLHPSSGNLQTLALSGKWAMYLPIYPWNPTHDGSMVLVYMLTWLRYIDGIHGTPYIAAPLGSVMGNGEKNFCITMISSWGKLNLVPSTGFGWHHLMVFSCGHQRLKNIKDTPSTLKISLVISWNGGCLKDLAWFNCYNCWMDPRCLMHPIKKENIIFNK